MTAYGAGGVIVTAPRVGVTVPLPIPGGVMVTNDGGVAVPIGRGGVAVANGLGDVAVANGLGDVAVGDVDVGGVAVANGLGGVAVAGAVVGRRVGCSPGSSVGRFDGSVACGHGVEVLIMIGNVNVGNGIGDRVGWRVTRVGTVVVVGCGVAVG